MTVPASALRPLAQSASRHFSEYFSYLFRGTDWSPSSALYGHHRCAVRSPPLVTHRSPSLVTRRSLRHRPGYDLIIVAARQAFNAKQSDLLGLADVPDDRAAPLPGADRQGGVGRPGPSVAVEELSQRAEGYLGPVGKVRFKNLTLPAGAQITQHGADSVGVTLGCAAQQVRATRR